MLVKRYPIKLEGLIKKTLLNIIKEYGTLRDFELYERGDPRILILGHFRELYLEKDGLRLIIEAPIPAYYKIKSFWEVLKKSTDPDKDVVCRSF